jgi:protein SCO1/2
MMKALLLGLLLIVSAQPADAGLSERDLATVGVLPPKHASVPLNLTFFDLSGRPVTLGMATSHRPTLLIPVDFTCRTVCGPELTIASGALAASGLKPGADYSLVVVGLDPNDAPADASHLLDQIGDATIRASVTVLSGTQDAVGILTQAVGYRFVYDQERDQFAHPAAALLIAPDGRLSRVLSGVALNPLDLRLAIVEAGQGRVGSLADRLTLLCYGFDALHGIYTLMIWRILELGAALTIAALVVFVLMLNSRSKLRASQRPA